ncbi:MAG: hypothetical protein MJE63_21485 [Proteobacteria bacterium]|nr:hypothetical protein [Pseudomonadota bacterium]
MSAKDLLKKKLEELDQKVKAKLAVHDMDPELKKMWKLSESYKKIGKNIDEQIDLIERMKEKVEKL